MGLLLNVKYRKIPVISPELIFCSKGLFAGLTSRGAYFLRGLFLEKILHFKVGLVCQ